MHDGKRWRSIDARVRTGNVSLGTKLTLTICLPDVPEDSKSFGLQPGQDRARQSRNQGYSTADGGEPEETADAVDVHQRSRSQRDQADSAGDNERYEDASVEGRSDDDRRTRRTRAW